MSLAIGVTTAPRPAPYLGVSIASLRAAGFPEPVHVFAEPGTPAVAAPGTVLHESATKLGCYPNWRRCLETLLAETDADWLLVLQDDVVYRSDARRRLEEGMAQLPECGFLSLYTSPSMVPPTLRDRPYGRDVWADAEFHNKAFWGCLALALPRCSARELADLPRFRQHNHHRKVDVLVGNCLRDLGRRRLVHLPSLADHIGTHSTIGRGADRFPGNQWARRGWQFTPGGRS